MFNIRKHDCIKFPSTQLNSCKKFKEMSPECKAKALEEQSSCALCTSFVHEIERCHLKRRGQATPTCGVSEGNNIYAAESTTICCIYQKAGTARQQPHSRTWENLGQSLCLTESTDQGRGRGRQWHCLHDGRQRSQRELHHAHAGKRAQPGTHTSHSSQHINRSRV